jgi:YjbE family integral membrane protein
LIDQLIAQFSLALGDYGPVGVQILKIIWINILLSGDNAVVIALACRALPRRQRIWGIILGAGAAVVLRIIFTVGLKYVLELPYLRFVGGLLLLYIAVKLLVQEEATEDSVTAGGSLWSAVKIVAVADIVMSLDNVLAIAGAATGAPPERQDMLIVTGLFISIPLVVFGATLIVTILHRYPILVWAGAGLLGWIAGQLIVEDPVSLPYFQEIADQYVYAPFGRHPVTYKIAEHMVQVLCTALVLLMGWLLMRWYSYRAGQRASAERAAAGSSEQKSAAE